MEGFKIYSTLKLFHDSMVYQGKQHVEN